MDRFVFNSSLWASLIVLVWSVGNELTAQSSFLNAPYTYKARNLRPADYGMSPKSWEGVLKICNARLKENPDDPETLLLRAVAYREYGVRRALLLRARDWKRSEADFATLFSIDSTFQDLHFQYGQLKRYKGEFEHALRLMHTQVDLRPELPYVAPALVRLYRQFLLEKDAEVVQTWLDAHPSGYATFFEAEMLRRSGQLLDADEKMSALLLNRRGLSYQPILLARARIYYALNRSDIAQSYVLQAIETIESEAEARLVAEDFKYIFTDDEADKFLSLNAPLDFKSFFYRLWEQRSPARSEDINRRLRAHYLRLWTAEKDLAYYAPREAYRVTNNVRMDRMADRDFPQAYWLNGEFSDKGLIFIRHGNPNTTVHSVSEGTPYLESWRYLDPDMDFHFEGFSNLAELIPSLPLDMGALEAREIWGGIYARLASSVRQRDGLQGVDRSSMNQMDLLTFGNELFDQSLKHARKGLSSDRHQWQRSLNHLDVPHVLASFRGSEGETRFEVHYAVPIGEVVPQLEFVDSRVDMKVGVALHDTSWNSVAKTYETIKAPATTDPSIAAIDFFRFDVPPDSYHVNVHAQIDDSDWLGSYQFDHRVPDLSGTGLLVSDVLPASNITPTTDTGRYIRNGLLLQVNPQAVYSRKNPVFVYFEVYNLTFAGNDRTQYSIRYSLVKPESKRRRVRLFRRKNDPVLSISYEREGDTLTAIEYGEIDMSDVPAGEYDLIITITDQTTGAEAASSRVIRLDK